MTDFIQSVTGAVDSKQIKSVLAHEHFFIDLSHQGPDADPRPVTPADREQLLRNPYSIRDNLILDNENTALEECRELAACGCNLVVECSNPGCGRQVGKLRELSERSGVHIVCGCGFYTVDTHPTDLEYQSVELLTEQLLDEIRFGAEGTTCKPGIIGEIGTSKEILSGERKALQAAGRASRESGLAVQIHIYPWSTNGLEALDILLKEKVAPERIVICHADVAPDREYILKLLKAGVFVEFDNFGKEFICEPGGFAAGTFAKDRERAALVAELMHLGFADKLLITNDICLKCMLREHGGEGYTHIFRNMIPLISSFGIPEEEIRQILLHNNPLRMLAGRIDN